MGIGFSVLLIAIGAILTFAVDVTVAGLDIRIVGWILMGAGVVGLLFTVFVLTPRRRRSTSETRTVDGTQPPSTTTTSSTSTGDPAPPST